MSTDPEPTTERLLREGEELLSSSQQLMRDVDEALRGSRAATGEPNPTDLT